MASMMFGREVILLSIIIGIVSIRANEEAKPRFRRADFNIDFTRIKRESIEVVQTGSVSKNDENNKGVDSNTQSTANPDETTGPPTFSMTPHHSTSAAESTLTTRESNVAVTETSSKAQQADSTESGNILQNTTQSSVAANKRTSPENVEVTFTDVSMATTQSTAQDKHDSNVVTSPPQNLNSLTQTANHATSEPAAEDTETDETTNDPVSFTTSNNDLETDTGISKVTSHQRTKTPDVQENTDSLLDTSDTVTTKSTISSTEKAINTETIPPKLAPVDDVTEENSTISSEDVHTTVSQRNHPTNTPTQDITQESMPATDQMEPHTTVFTAVNSSHNETSDFLTEMPRFQNNTMFNESERRPTHGQLPDNADNDTESHSHLNTTDSEALIPDGETTMVPTVGASVPQDMGVPTGASVKTGVSTSVNVITDAGIIPDIDVTSGASVTTGASVTSGAGVTTGASVTTDPVTPGAMGHKTTEVAASEQTEDNPSGTTAMIQGTKMSTTIAESITTASSETTESASSETTNMDSSQTAESRTDKQTTGTQKVQDGTTSAGGGFTESSTRTPEVLTTVTDQERTTGTGDEATATIKEKPTSGAPVNQEVTTAKALSSSVSMTTSVTTETASTGSPIRNLPKVYVSVIFQVVLKLFCAQRGHLKNYIAEFLINIKKKTELKCSQVELVLETGTCPQDKHQECANVIGSLKSSSASGMHNLHRAARMKRSTKVQVFIYMKDSSGKYDQKLTELYASEVNPKTMYLPGIPKTEDFKVGALKVHGYTPKTGASMNNQKTGAGTGVLVAIILSAIAAVCFMAFMVLQVMIWRRRRGVKTMRPHGNSIDDAENVQLTNVRKHNGHHYAYINPGLQTEEKDYTSNSLTFEGIKKALKDHDVIEDEFLMLPSFLPKLAVVPAGCEDKNRYANVIPEPKTRVPLSLKPGEENSDYINANYISGYMDEPVCYIATQAPMKNTLGDFWRMVWEQQSKLILMLTQLEENGVSKCEEYWPNTDGGDILRICGDFEVRQIERDSHRYWTYTKLKVTNTVTNTSREINHLWYTAWPTHGLPEKPNSLLNYLLYARALALENYGPIIVHCSPGTGRTGTVIAIDICMQDYDDSHTANILRTVHNLRHERAGAVQTKEQFFFIYKAIYEYARRLGTPESTRSSISIERTLL